MFHTPAWRDNATARPVYKRGHAFTRLSLRRYWSPIAPKNKAENTAWILIPVTQSPRVIMMRAEARARRAGMNTVKRTLMRISAFLSSFGRVGLGSLWD